MTSIDICNSALYKIGANSINAFTDDTKEAEACNLRYELCKRTVLRMHPWECAITRVILTPTTTTPPYGYQYQFNLPGDFVRLVSVNPETQSDYKLESKTIVGDFSNLYLKYVADVDESLIDDLVGEAIASYLAWDISFAITQNGSLKQQLAQEKKEAISKAKLANAQEMKSQEVQANYFLDARLGPVAANLSEARDF
jgi:hypothetical protein